MRLRPPVDQILVAIDPGFVVGAVGDRRPGLFFLVDRVGVIPVVPLATRDIGLQVLGVVDRPPVDIGMI